jgi:hypothetical protein
VPRVAGVSPRTPRNARPLRPCFNTLSSLPGRSYTLTISSERYSLTQSLCFLAAVFLRGVTWSRGQFPEDKQMMEAELDQIAKAMRLHLAGRTRGSRTYGWSAIDEKRGWEFLLCLRVLGPVAGMISISTEMIQRLADELRLECSVVGAKLAEELKDLVDITP